MLCYVILYQIIMYVPVYIYIYMYIHTHVRVHVYIYIYTYIYIYICTYIVHKIGYSELHSYARSTSAQVLKQCVVAAEVVTVCWSYEMWYHLIIGICVLYVYCYVVDFLAVGLRLGELN